jgi:hypothetical protein
VARALHIICVELSEWPRLGASTRGKGSGVTHFAGRDLIAERQGEEVLRRHIREVQPGDRAETEPPVIGGLAQHHAATGPLPLKPLQAIPDQRCPYSLALTIRPHRDRAEAEPAAR